MKFSIQANPIDLSQFALDLHGPEEGGIVHFFGVARTSSHESSKKVIRLEYEAYEVMARAEMEKIFSETKRKFGVNKTIVIHRTGIVEIGQAAVAIAVASAHRAEAFDACRYLIDELKKRVPIWKKEVYVDGSEWVGSRP